ncbi:MAG TPA: ATP-binding cassette domain-containing protein, partial [Hyphomicrobiales bacterium]|nr:ATP-binding cassette domain-containing protein [Hyphomicrobiales bacterium]
MGQIEIRNVYKIFGDDPQSVLPEVKAGASKDEILARTGHTVGLSDITLSVEKGEIFVVMGLSGSGKSTLIRHLNRLIEPTAGSITFEGTDVLGLSAAELREFRRHTMSMVFQRFGLLPHRTVLENVAFGLEIQGVAPAQRREKGEEWI